MTMLTLEQVGEKVDKLTTAVEQIAKDQKTGSKYLLTMARDIYKDDLPEEDEVMMPEERLPVEEEEVTKRRYSKGFDDTADKASDEEDSKYRKGKVSAGDTPESDVKGNEGQPPAVVPGPEESDVNKEDESFGPGGMAYKAQVAKLNARVAALEKEKEDDDKDDGEVIAKSIVPGGVIDKRAGTGSGVALTREMQEETKKRSYREINRLREEVGDLPRNMF